MDIPYLTALKTTPDPANIWSWHHSFATPATVEVLVDVDGNNVMDREHSWLRVMITDIEVVDTQNASGTAMPVMELQSPTACRRLRESA